MQRLRDLSAQSAGHLVDWVKSALHPAQAGLQNENESDHTHTQDQENAQDQRPGSNLCVSCIIHGFYYT